MTREYWREDVQGWYGISFQAPDSFRVKVHKTVFEHLKAMPWETAPLIKMWKASFSGIGEFVPPNESVWGFKDSFRTVKSGFLDWVCFECKFPVLKEIGKESADKTNVYALRVSLATLFIGLEMFEGDTGISVSECPQLMIVEGLWVEADMNGGSLCVALTPAVCRWLHKQTDDSRLIEVENAMKLADGHMWQKKKTSPDIESCYFRAWCRQPKWLNLGVPGNACGLDPESYNDGSLDRGYQLTPHNVDSSVQQLTFLAGLGCLHDLIRKG